MSVLILFDYPYYHGGVSRVLNLAKALKKDVKVYLVGAAFDRELPFWRYKVREEVVDGVNVTRFYANHLLPFLLFQFIFLHRFLRSYTIDILQTYNPTYVTCISPMILKLIYKLRLVLMYDDIVTQRDELGFFHRRVLLLIEKSICILSDKIVVLTSYQRDYLMKKGIPKAKLSIIPNLVDVDAIASSMKRSEDLKQRLGIDQRIVLGYVGSVNRRIGLEDMIKVMHMLQKKRIHLVVVGGGDALDELNSLVTEVGAQNMVTFIGRVPHRDVGKYYSIMDFLICPLKHHPANLAVDHMKLYEYLATGKPVIAARVGSVLDAIKDGENGILYTSGDIEELCDKIQYLVIHPLESEKMGSAGRMWVKKKHDSKVIGRLWKNLFYELIGGRSTEIFEREYTSLYLPIEVDKSLELIGYYINSGKEVLICTDDEVLLFEILNRSFTKTYVLTRKKRFFQKLQEIFSFEARLWNGISKFDTMVVGLREPKTDALNEIDKALLHAKTILILSPMFIRYCLSESRYKVPTFFINDLAYPFSVTGWLRDRGYSVKIYGYHTLLSILISRFVWLLNLFGKESLADRIYFRDFMKHLGTDSWLKYVSTLLVVVGRKNA